MPDTTNRIAVEKTMRLRLKSQVPQEVADAIPAPAGRRLAALIDSTFLVIDLAGHAAYLRCPEYSDPILVGLEDINHDNFEVIDLDNQPNRRLTQRGMRRR